MERLPAWPRKDLRILAVHCLLSPFTLSSVGLDSVYEVKLKMGQRGCVSAVSMWSVETCSPSYSLTENCSSPATCHFFNQVVIGSGKAVLRVHPSWLVLVPVPGSALTRCGWTSILLSLSP